MRGQKMRDSGGNSISSKEPRFFSFKEAFLTRKNYKVIFCITFMIEAFKIALVLLFEWDLTGWWNYSLFILILILVFISALLFLLIPVVVVVRILFTHLLKKKIDQLEQVIWQRRKTIY
ncbi:hypothetical protein D1093_09565 [Bartonella kosoyi]|uniref:DUF4282 domain-containing protein n=2 Tax=Bartonella kosoyi TaxID=2133959 RepID=A0A5B9CZS8_9HYPH|nr:hypothetical protein D1093_09565 [Bartonella kosoyi]